MSLHRDSTNVVDAEYSLVTRTTAPDDIACDITASHALYVGDGNGDGLVIEGDLAALVRWVDKLHAAVHRQVADDLARWAHLFGDGELADELAPKLNCGEAEITADALHAAGNSRSAETFLAAHICRDTEDGETHDTEGTGQESTA